MRSRFRPRTILLALLASVLALAACSGAAEKDAVQENAAAITPPSGPGFVVLGGTTVTLTSVTAGADGLPPQPKVFSWGDMVWTPSRGQDGTAFVQLFDSPVLTQSLAVGGGVAVDGVQPIIITAMTRTDAAGAVAAAAPGTSGLKMVFVQVTTTPGQYLVITANSS
ncbi:hypothetical protein [Pseudonocardia sp. SCN 73-27]|uniref:hypothetical protein n=1 Tax=Pseudonocardia sp. SCN 73-27 TaxID=1660132 RepID=UPI0025F84883|nr:hypothetical protein [Pseudonocardia sp. SCN 73-27]